MSALRGTNLIAGWESPLVTSRFRAVSAVDGESLEPEYVDHGGE